MSEPDQTTRNLVIGSAGHIDHGKTSLVRALTGVDTDRLPAEKQRGITIDLGFASLDLGNNHLAIVDVPGHERFIRNMLAGATGLDLALLVVAADDSVMPQTREHLEILRYLGMTTGVIAVTKCDLVDADWAALVADEVRQFVAGSFLADAPIILTSVATGQGLDELRQALSSACESVPDRRDPGLFRMAIDRAFTLAGHGAVVTGTVASGAVAVGDALEWWPSGKAVRVRGLHRHDHAIEKVSRGMRAAINLASVHHSEIERGHELATPGYLAASRVLSIQLEVSPEARRPLRHRQRYRLHLGTAEVTATLGLLDSPEALPGTTCLAQLMVASPLVAVAGQPFVLRDESPPATVGGGRVVEPTARRIRRRDQLARQRLSQRVSDDPATRLLATLETQGLALPGTLALSRETGLTVAEVEATLAELRSRGEIIELPIGPRRSTPVAAGVAAELEDRVLRSLARGHAARPRQSTLKRGDIAAGLADLGSDTVVSGIIERLRVAGKVVADARTIALKGHEPKLTQAERRLKNELAESLAKAALAPPDQAELTNQAGVRGSIVLELLTILAEEGRIVEIGGGIWLDFDAEQDVRARVTERLNAPNAPGLTMADLRDLLGTTRKYAVPIGEYLDRVALTRREGDLRFAGSAVRPNSVEPPPP